MKPYSLIFGTIATTIIIAGCSFRSMFSVTPPEMNPDTPRYLIVNADDLCLSPSINEGIIEAYRNGVVTSTTAMINMPDAPEMLLAVHERVPELPIGLHINITTGRSVLPAEQVPTLVDTDGFFYDSNRIPYRLLKISTEEVRAEVTAQIERYLDTGVPLSHLDYHHHMVALYAPFHEVVRELALQFNLPVRNPVPVSVYDLIELEGGGGDDAQRRMIAMGLRRPVTGFRLMRKINPVAFRKNHDDVRELGITTTDWFIDSFYSNASVEHFLAILDQLPPGISEIMVHPEKQPGFKNETGSDRAGDTEKNRDIEEGKNGVDKPGYVHAEDDYPMRKDELLVLTHPAVRNKINELDIILTDFTRISKIEAQ